MNTALNTSFNFGSPSFRVKIFVIPPFALEATQAYRTTGQYRELQDFVKYVSTRFGFQPRVEYRDDEGEWILVSTPQEWQQMQVSSSQNFTVRVQDANCPAKSLQTSDATSRVAQPVSALNDDGEETVDEDDAPSITNNNISFNFSIQGTPLRLVEVNSKPNQNTPSTAFFAKYVFV